MINLLLLDYRESNAFTLFSLIQLIKTFPEKLLFEEVQGQLAKLFIGHNDYPPF
jgi:hypothetical protein